MGSEKNIRITEGYVHASHKWISLIERIGGAMWQPGYQITQIDSELTAVSVVARDVPFAFAQNEEYFSDASLLHLFQKITRDRFQSERSIGCCANSNRQYLLAAWEGGNPSSVSATRDQTHNFFVSHGGQCLP